MNRFKNSFFILALALAPGGPDAQARAVGGKSLAPKAAPGTIAAADPLPNKVIYLDREKVRQAFAKGELIFDGKSGQGNYSILAGRREAPGQVEIHAKDTDIFYVLEGTATFVTGGTPVDAKTTAPDEQRGASITGGDAHHLVKGDVIIIPSGVPHWFKEVQPTLLYFVVKVRR